MAKVKEGRAVIDNILESGEVAYGINTGFGLFSKVVVSKDQLHDLQVNLIVSHASGVGAIAAYKNSHVNGFKSKKAAKGHSGISIESLRQILDAFNKDVFLPYLARGQLVL